MKRIGISGAGCGKSSQELKEIIEMAMEANKSGHQIRRCGSSWVCCNGECERCLVSRMTTTNRTEPSSIQTYSNSTETCSNSTQTKFKVRGIEDE